MEKERKFKLLQDTPECRVGDIFEQDGDVYVHQKTRSWYRHKIVEQSPLWFAEIVETVFPKGILEFEATNGKRYTLEVDAYNNWVELNLTKWGSKITKVQNSSGEVFSVGDVGEYCGVHKFKIESLGVFNDEIWAYYDGKSKSWNIDFLEKPSAPKVFTQEQVEKAIKECDKGETNLMVVRCFRKALGI